MKDQDRRKIENTINKLVLGWGAADAKPCQSAWDLTYPEAFLLLPEFDAPIFGPEAVKTYYDQLGKEYPQSKVEIGNLKITKVNDIDDLAHVSFDMPTEVVIPEYPDAPIILKVKQFWVHSRASIVMRKRDGEWYIIYYHESIPWHPEWLGFIDHTESVLFKGMK
jgi:hypothetical protein